MTGVALATMALVAAPASAKVMTLRYFVKQVSVSFTDAAGHHLNPHKPAAAGDKGDVIGLAYVGDHKHHAKNWTASYHLSCVFRSATRNTCDLQIAIGGSMLLANGVHLNLKGNRDRFSISAGTGVFQGAHGTAQSVTVHNTSYSDITLKIRMRGRGAKP